MTKHALLFVVMAIMGLSSAAQAELFKDKTGSSVCMPNTSPEDIFKRPDGSIVRRANFSCITTSDSSFPFDHQKHTCFGTFELGLDGKPGKPHGYCVVLSTKGDRAS